MATQPRLAATAAILLATALLGACGDTPGAQALRGIWSAPAPEPQAAPAQGPALLLLAPQRATLLPVQGTGARRLWRGAGNVAIATDGPRIVATAGLGQMVMATRFEGPDPLEDARALAAREATSRRTVDLAGADRDPSGMRFGVSLDCRLRGQAEAGWLVVEERCTGPGIGFTNRFWVDPATGLVRRSEQWAGDRVGLLTIQMQGI